MLESIAESDKIPQAFVTDRPNSTFFFLFFFGEFFGIPRTMRVSKYPSEVSAKVDHRDARAHFFRGT